MTKISRVTLKKTVVLGGAALFFCALIGNALAANSKPQTGTVNPASGISDPNQQVIFTTTYSDANGWQDIKQANLLINTSASASKCFYGYYNRSENKIYLRNDNNKAWLGGIAPGAPGTIENSYVKLDCAQSAVTGNNTSLTITWAITFKPAFAGRKNIYLYVKDAANAYAGWVKSGTWAINSPPQTGSVKPSSGLFTQNKQLYFVAAYIDADGAKDLHSCFLLISGAINGTNCLYAYYNQNENKIYLRDDRDSEWLGGFAPRSQNKIENSQVIIDCAKTLISGSGKTLAIKWAITFKPAFGGLKNTYLSTRDDRGIFSGWIKRADACILRQPIQPPN